MNEEEKKAIERIDYFEPDDLLECAMYRDCVEKIKNLIEKQQKEIKELNSEFAINTEIHKRDMRIKELEEVNNCLHETSKDFISKDKIRELKTKVEEEMISNPYDFSYMIQELLGE